MKIEFIPFRAEHLDLIIKRPAREEGGIILTDSQKGVMERAPSMTMLVDGVIKACGGCVYLWPNTGEFWAVTAPDIGHYKKAFNEFVLTLIDDVTRALRLTRLQATVKADFRVGVRWIIYLGFKLNTVLKKYIDDQDYLLFERIMGD